MTGEFSSLSILQLIPPTYLAHTDALEKGETLQENPEKSSELLREFQNLVEELSKLYSYSGPEV